MSVRRGSVKQTNLYPLYGGVVVLAGLIVGASEIIHEDIMELKESKLTERKTLSEGIQEHANERKES